MDLLGEEGRARAWSQFYSFFIEPALEKRSDLAWCDVYTLLIKLPQDQEPIVEFNEDVGFLYQVEDPNERKAGEGLAFHEIGEIKRIVPPKVDGVYVAYAYAWRTDTDIHFTFDFGPNHSDFDASSHKLSQGLEFHLKCKFTEKMLPDLLKAQTVLLKHGLALFPRLLNYPINKMVKLFQEGNSDLALKVLRDYASPDIIRTVVAQWNRVDSFVAREPLFDESLVAHENGHYHLSINALIGHVEGIITDWLYKEVNDPSDVPNGYKARIENFKQTIEVTVTPEFAVNKVIESICEFLISPETLLQGYFDWDSPQPNTDSTHRHMLAHGKYIREYFTEVNSIKLFLVLDSICFCIECYEDHKHKIQMVQTP